MLASSVAAYLDSIGIVTYDPDGVSGNTFIDLMPDKPDAAIGLFDYAGPPGDALHGYDYPNLQARTRNLRDPRPAKATLAEIYNALHNLHGIELPGGIWLVSCWARQSGPTPLGPDANGRHEFTMNFEFHVRNVTAHRE